MHTHPDPKLLQPGSNRERLYDHIRNNPGLHFRQLQRELGMPLGTLDYHLWWMERHQLVTTRQFQRYKAYYTNGGQERREKDYIYFLRRPMPREILLQLREHGQASFRALLKALPISASTLSFHLKKLAAQNVVRGWRKGRAMWFAVEQPDLLRSAILSCSAAPGTTLLAPTTAGPLPAAPAAWAPARAPVPMENSG